MNLIIPAAGRSTRFPNVRPKWLLTHPNGNLMITEAIKGLNLSDLDRIYMVVLKEHLDRYQFKEGLEKQIDKIGQLEKFKLIVLEDDTKHQPETIAMAIKKENIKGQIFVKDTDNYYLHKIEKGNYLTTFSLNDLDMVNPRNKSYVTTDENNMVLNIAEKKVISDVFSVGGYAFADAEQFLDYYQQLQDEKGLYVSHIIYKMLLDNISFEAKECKNYQDWGTSKDWNKFKKQYNTLFVDIDGILVVNSAPHFPPYWGETKGIKENIEILTKLYDTGKVQIILTTSRTSAVKDITERQLEREGMKYHQIIYNLYHAKRIIINDFAASNPYKSCDAINLKRNSTELREMLEEALDINF